MKKNFIVMKLMVAFIFMSIATTVSAANCSKVVDLMCDSFNAMSKEVSKCKSMEELSALDYDEVLTDVNGDDLPDSCMQYKLTSRDKTRIKGSIKSFSDAVSNKMYDLTGGVLSKDYIVSMMDTEMQKFYNALDKAVTFEDFTNAIGH